MPEQRECHLAKRRATYKRRTEASNSEKIETQRGKGWQFFQQETQEQREIHLEKHRAAYKRKKEVSTSEQMDMQREENRAYDREREGSKKRALKNEQKDLKI